MNAKSSGPVPTKTMWTLQALTVEGELAEVQAVR